MQAKILVRGMVQMVGYRYFALRNALQIGIKGHVRNTSGGCVEILAEAEKKVLDEYLEILKRGPSSADVEGVEVSFSEENDMCTDFSIKY